MVSSYELILPLSFLALEARDFLFRFALVVYFSIVFSIFENRFGNILCVIRSRPVGIEQILKNLTLIYLI
jgi:hypothetical protein